MTEQDWLTAAEPQAMFEFLRRTSQANERQLRLFAVACCRRAWYLLTDERSRAALETSERFADGLASQEALQEAQDRANGVTLDIDNDLNGWESAAFAVLSSCWSGSQNLAGHVSGTVSDILGLAPALHPGERPRLARQVERRRLCRLLRDIIGPRPFRPLSSLVPAVLAWNDGLVVKLAQAAYDDRLLPSGQLHAVRLAILADGLEEAGADPVLLEHLRGPGPHVRGCFVVDLLTGREGTP